MGACASKVKKKNEDKKNQSEADMRRLGKDQRDFDAIDAMSQQLSIDISRKERWKREAQLFEDRLKEKKDERDLQESAKIDKNKLEVPSDKDSAFRSSIHSGSIVQSRESSNLKQETTKQRRKTVMKPSVAINLLQSEKKRNVSETTLRPKERLIDNQKTSKSNMTRIYQNTSQDEIHETLAKLKSLYTTLSAEPEKLLTQSTKTQSKQTKDEQTEKAKEDLDANYSGIIKDYMKMNTINTPVSEAEESEDEHSVQNRLKASINDYIEKKKSVILNDSKSSSRSQSVEDREDRDKTAKTPL